jgi:hypothetical protein
MVETKGESGGYTEVLKKETHRPGNQEKDGDVFFTIAFITME